MFFSLPSANCNQGDLPMSNRRPISTQTDNTTTEWADLFRDGRGSYSLLVIMSTMLHALQNPGDGDHHAKQ